MPMSLRNCEQLLYCAFVHFICYEKYCKEHGSGRNPRNRNMAAITIDLNVDGHSRYSISMGETQLDPLPHLSVTMHIASVL